ncbi:hypothetical protein [Picosynechococcus sp. PCC 7003]|nr:hypothetical protein [Picosynechococcus sp. PCC 7003]
MVADVYKCLLWLILTCHGFSRESCDGKAIAPALGFTNKMEGDR